MKVFEVQMSNVSDVLMRVTQGSANAKPSECSTQNAMPTTDSAVQVNQKKKPGRPMTTHRKDDEELFKFLRHNPDGSGVKRKEWQLSKWQKFKSG